MPSAVCVINDRMTKTVNKLILAILLLALVAALPACMWQRQRARRQIVMVSEQFVRAVSTMDVLALRRCVVQRDRAVLPSRFASAAAGKLRELNKDVRIGVHTRITRVAIGQGEATVRLKRVVTERGTRLGKPVDTKTADECTVICAYDGSRWLVDLDRTARDNHFRVGDILRECISR